MKGNDTHHTHSFPLIARVFFLKKICFFVCVLKHEYYCKMLYQQSCMKFLPQSLCLDFIFNYFYMFSFMCKSFACMYVCASCACLVLEEVRRGYWSPKTQTYTWLETTMQVFLTSQPSLQFLCLDFKIRICRLRCMSFC